MPTLGNSPWWLEASTSADLENQCERLVVSPSSVTCDGGPWRCLQQEPSGLYAAVNYGMLADGDWNIGTYLNDDDRLVKDGVVAARKILENDSSLAGVYGRVHLVDSKGRRMEAIPVCRRAEDLGPLLARGIVPLAQPGTLFRREVFDSLGGFDSGWRAAGDMDFFMRSWKLGHRYRFVDACVAEFRIHPGQISQDAVAQIEREKLVESARDQKDWVRQSFGAMCRFRYDNRQAYCRRIVRRGFVSMNKLYQPKE